MLLATIFDDDLVRDPYAPGVFRDSGGLIPNLGVFAEQLLGIEDGLQIESQILRRLFLNALGLLLPFAGLQPLRRHAQGGRDVMQLRGAVLVSVLDARKGRVLNAGQFGQLPAGLALHLPFLPDSVADLHARSVVETRYGMPLTDAYGMP